jgi:uncharacterized protein (TIRG00374 family)
MQEKIKNFLKNNSLFLKLILGLVLISLVYWKIGFWSIIDTILSISIIFLVLYILLKVLSFFIGALNIAILLKPFNHKIKTRVILRYSMLSWAIGLFAPAKLGELSLVYFLHKKGISISKALIVFLIDKILTFIVLFFFGISAILLFVPQLFWLYVLCFLLVIGGLCLFLFNQKIFQFLLNSFFKKYTLHLVKFKEELLLFIKENPKLLFVNFLLTAFKWSFTAFAIKVLFWAFGINVQFFKILFIQSAITFVTFLPITMNGIGVTEPLGIFLYGLVGVDYYISASLFAVALFVTYLLGLFFILSFYRSRK